MFEYTINRPSTITGESIADIIDSAGYGINYWATGAVVDSANETYTISWNGDDFEDSDPLATGTKALTYLDIAKTIESLLNFDARVSDSTCRAFADAFYSENIDSDWADVIIQLALFNEVIYG